MQTCLYRRTCTCTCTCIFVYRKYIHDVKTATCFRFSKLLKLSNTHFDAKDEGQNECNEPRNQINTYKSISQCGQCSQCSQCNQYSQCSQCSLSFGRIHSIPEEGYYEERRK